MRPDYPTLLLQVQARPKGDEVHHALGQLLMGGHLEVHAATSGGHTLKQPSMGIITRRTFPCGITRNIHLYAVKVSLQVAVE